MFRRVAGFINILLMSCSASRFLYIKIYFKTGGRNMIALFLVLVVIAIPMTYFYFFRAAFRTNKHVDVRNRANRIAKYNWVEAQRYLDENYY